MQPLASPDDVAAALGRSLTVEEQARLGIALERISSVFRMHARQDFTPSESTVRLEVVGDSVLLRQRPVLEVSAIVDDAGDAVDATLVGNVLTLHAPDVQAVTVTYTHGSADVPDLVRTTVAEAAKRALLVAPQASAGIAQHSLTTAATSETTTYSTAVQGGPVPLTDDEVKIARSFRVIRPRTVVQVA